MIYILITEDNEVVQFSDEPTKIDWKLVVDHGYDLLRVGPNGAERAVGMNQWESIKTGVLLDEYDNSGQYHGVFRDD